MGSRAEHVFCVLTCITHGEKYERTAGDHFLGAVRHFLEKHRSLSDLSQGVSGRFHTGATSAATGGDSRVITVTATVLELLVFCSCDLMHRHLLVGYISVPCEWCHVCGVCVAVLINLDFRSVCILWQ